MTSIKLKFRPSTVQGREGKLVFQVIHKRQVKCVPTEYRLFPSEWDAQYGKVCLTCHDEVRLEHLRALSEHIRLDALLFNRVLTKYQSSMYHYTADDMVKNYQQLKRQQSFSSFMHGVVEQLRSLGRVRTAEAYAATLRSFDCFMQGGDTLFCGIDSTLMQHYQAWLKHRGVSQGTVSFYMRIMRAVYNRAVENGLTDDKHPFCHVYTGVPKTPKRAISLHEIRLIKELNLSDSPLLEFARDMFIFSFLTRGMSFVDMAYLKKTDLNHGMLHYRRHKTGQQLRIKWERSMQAIVSHYKTPNSPYLLPIIKKHGEEETSERRQYENTLHLVNNKLKEVARLAGLHTNLTTYVARHSWACAARSRKIPIAVISEGMGHDSERTTQIYLNSIETSVIDHANKLILKGLGV